MNEGCSIQEDTANLPSPTITKTEPQRKLPCTSLLSRAPTLNPSLTTLPAPSPPSNPPLSPSRPPIVPSSFYTTSLAKNHKMDLATLGQAFNAHPTDLKHLLNTASIILAEHNCLNTPSRSKTITAARSEAVLAAIRSMPFFSGFFEKSLRRYDAFVAAMLASVAKLCDEEFRAWRRKRGEGGGGMGMHCVFET